MLGSFILFLIIVLLVFSPIPKGSVKPLYVLMIQLLSFLIFILWVLKLMSERVRHFESARPYIPLIIFIIICLFQIVPLPSSLLGILSEKTLEIWRSTDSALVAIGYQTDKDFFTLSLYPDATLKKTLLLLSYLAFGIVVARSFRGGRQIRFVIISVLAIMVFEAASGIYQYLSSGSSEDARGTFVNRNHYAGFLEMCFPLALGYVLSLGDWSGGARKSLTRRFIISESAHKQILFLFLLGIVLLALILSESRAGIFSMLVSLLFFYFVSSRFLIKGIEIKWMIYAVLTVAFFFGLYIGLYPLVERYLLIEENLPSRTLVWRDTIRIIKDFPLFGTGLGTFGYVYPLYKVSIAKPIIYLYSHNDYLQVTVETGLLGFMSLMAALLLFIYSSVKALIRISSGHDSSNFFLLLGTLTGILSILIHSFADFNLQIPSNGLYFAFLIGLAAALGSDGQDSD